MAECLELTDEIAGFSGGIEMAPVPVSTQLLVGGGRGVDQVAGDDEYRADDGNERLGVAAAFDDAAVAGAEEGVGAGGGVGGLAEGALEPEIALAGRVRGRAGTAVDGIARDAQADLSGRLGDIDRRDPGDRSVPWSSLK
ncbi:hypothetical protein KUF83_28300 [Streptomyces sp. BV286]|uniref:hypothetical protein n=1 Tax=Streptomyces sp. BV286 TaxID=2849672 RepID=UPI001C2EFB46|nr:hypothetical protein [Streptomyces sp. BV286]